MNKLTSAFISVAVLTAVSAVRISAVTQVYDLNTDWSDTQNPNGPWSYREGDTLLTSDPVSWVGADYFCTTALCSLFGAPAIAKAGGEPDPFGPWLVIGYQNIQEGDILVMTGPAQSANVLWTAPASGSIDITGFAWWAEDFLCGDFGLSSWTLTHNGSMLSSGSIETPCAGNTRDYPHNFSTGSAGAAALQNLPVAAGDQIVLAFSGADKFGVNLTITLTPESVDPVAAIENLALIVVEMNLQNGISNSLDSKLDAALSALEDANVNNDGAACNSLSAFLNAVEAQRGKKITNAQANQLVIAGHDLRTMLGCSN